MFFHEHHIMLSVIAVLLISLAIFLMDKRGESDLKRKNNNGVNQYQNYGDLQNHKNSGVLIRLLIFLAIASGVFIAIMIRLNRHV